MKHAPRTLSTLPGFLAAEACAALVARAERIGFAAAPITTGRGFVMRTDIRNNTRVMVDDLALAATLWSKLEPHVEPHAASGGARPIGLNERFRFYRYEAGEKFAWHYDGSFRRKGEASRLTFMVYLNEGFEGGATEFVDDEVDEPIVVPKIGMAVLFDHHLRHQGAPVVRGTKYVLRSDVMFECEDARYVVIG